MATPPCKHSPITTLADAFCYQVSDPKHATSSATGDVLSATSHKKTFPRALKRLRDRLRLLEDRLSLDTNALHQQVLNLELEKTLLEKKLRGGEDRRRQRIVSIIEEYLSVFQGGWVLSPVEAGDRKLDSTAASVQSVNLDRRALLADRQRHFLAEAVDSRARDQVTTFWQLFTDSYGSPRLGLDRVDIISLGDETIVVARGMLTGQINQVTVRREYPNALRDSQLIQQLMDTIIQFPCRLTCVLTTSGTIIQHELELDHVSALQKVLGNLEHVHRVMGCS